MTSKMAEMQSSDVENKLNVLSKRFDAYEESLAKHDLMTSKMNAILSSDVEEKLKMVLKRMLARSLWLRRIRVLV
jgi:hypothetical protein